VFGRLWLDPKLQRLDAPNEHLAGTTSNDPPLTDDSVLAVAAEQLGVAAGDLGHLLSW
jgi:non-ribosomal peptide synthetase component E (peptide arylation enzyme)